MSSGTHAPTTGKSSSYIAGLDGIRAIAFFLVFFAHTAWGRMAVLIPATLGVTIFFFLSGFLITTLLRRELDRTGTIHLRDFYLRRALRILVPLYLVYAIAELVARFVLHHGAGTVQGALSMLLYYFNYGYALGDSGVVGNIYAPVGLSVIWSLCIEEHFYLLFPAVYLWFWRSRASQRTQKFWLIGFCVVELLWRLSRILLHFRSTTVWNYYATDTRLDSILWGAVLAMFWNPLTGDPTLLPKRHKGLVAGVALVALIGSLAIPGTIYRDAFRYSVQAILLLFLFSFVVADTGHWSVRWLENPVIRYLGWISYVLYLSHYLIAYTVAALLPTNPWMHVALSLVFSIAFASVVRYTVELPLQRLRAKFRRVPVDDGGDVRERSPASHRAAS